jgi:hypothetical protein
MFLDLKLKKYELLRSHESSGAESKLRFGQSFGIIVSVSSSILVRLVIKFVLETS